MKQPKDLIFVCNVSNPDEQSFKNTSHLDNFLKYLFSCSNNHKENDKTKRNFYLNQDPKTKRLNKFAFVIGGKERYDAFTNQFKELIKNPSVWKNDLHWAAFMVVIENKIVGNTFVKDKNSKTLQYALTDQAVGYIAADYFAGDTEDYMQTVESMINNSNKEYIHFDDASEAERLHIEKLVHSKLRDASEDMEVLIAVSHHDQEDHDMYHIHRILKK